MQPYEFAFGRLPQQCITQAALQPDASYKQAIPSNLPGGVRDFDQLLGARSYRMEIAGVPTLRKPILKPFAACVSWEE